MAKRAKLCWWCNGQLEDHGSRLVKEQLGNNVEVHAACEKDTKNYMKQATAQPPDRTVNKSVY